MNYNSEQWSSRLAFIWVTSGAAVGLGNIWLFSYLAGENGGSVFVLTFLLCILFIGIPTMIAEVLGGAISKKDPINGIKTLSQTYGFNQHWHWIGWLGALALLMILSFYSVVAGWSLGYFVYAISGKLINVTQTEVMTLWNQFIDSPLQLLLWHTLFMLITLSIVARGVQSGIEKASKIMMPGLFIILIYLVIYSAINGDFKTGLNFLFKLDFSVLNPKIILTAMGQAFFSLALGAGALFVYGAYLPARTPFVGALCLTTILNTLVAILSGLAIFPLIFKFGLEPSSGPGLMFQALPTAFSQMPGGIWVSSLFFLLLIFAALTSTFSLAEPLILILLAHTRLTRKKASICVGLFAWSLGLTALLSFNMWKEFKLLGKYTFFDLLTHIPIDLIIPIGGLSFAFIAAWKIPHNIAKERLQLHPLWFNVWLVVTRFITPLGILSVFIYGLIS